jgi:hypothetical protein
MEFVISMRLARPILRLTRHERKFFLSPSFRVLLTPLTYIHVGEDAKTAKVFLGVLCGFARDIFRI